MSRRIVVVGGGITGLATAWLLRNDHDVEVTVLEAGKRTGGIVCTQPFAGAALDVGPDAMLARQPEGPDLARRLGLGDDLTAPATGGVRLWARNGLRPLPAGTVLGVPTRLSAVARAGVLSASGLARAALEPMLPGTPLTGDASVADVVGRRFGPEVVDTLVEPLLGGVYAGRADQLSVTAAAAPVAEAARAHRSLRSGLRAHRRAVVGAAGPVFLTVRGGLGRLTDGLTRDLGPAVLTGATATALERSGAAWRVTSTRGEHRADAVVLAVPAFAAGSLLADVAPPAARELATVAYASVGVVALAYPSDAARTLPPGSGLLVPRSMETLTKAATWVSQKWAHHAGDGTLLVRASVGRVDDDRALVLDDDALVAAVTAELSRATGLRAAPTQARVVRWERALPQYTVGHRQRVARIRAALAHAGPGLHAGGAAFDGVGVCACIRQAGELAAAATRGLRG